MFLIDTNIILEIFLGRTNSREAKLFLRSVPFTSLYFTDLTIYTIATILIKHNKHESFKQMVSDLFTNGEAWRIQVGAESIDRILEVSRTYNLCFGDAYNYVAAEEYNLDLISFNSAYDQTERGRKTPADILEGGQFL